VPQALKEPHMSARITKGYADCRDGQIHYRRTGTVPGRPLVFLHQTASSGAMFELVMARMASRRSSIAFDTPGFDISLPYLAERLVEAMDALCIAEFDLCGHHTGGCIALEIANMIPDRMRSLALIGPVIASPEERDSYRGTFVSPFSFNSDGSHLKTAWDYLATIGAGTTPQLHQRELIDHMLGIETMPKAFSAVWDQDSEGRLKSIAAPLLLMCSKDDVLWRIFHNAEAARPDAQVAIVEGMDFQPDIDPDGVVAGLADFLDRLN
jgi:pimeloyl-ACP methyl ester carboxylesterase